MQNIHQTAAGLMDRKLEEFLQLQQGEKSVHVYARQFNALARYATHHVDTDGKKRERGSSGDLTPT